MTPGPSDEMLSDKHEMNLPWTRSPSVSRPSPAGARFGPTGGVNVFATGRTPLSVSTSTGTGHRGRDVEITVRPTISGHRTPGRSPSTASRRIGLAGAVALTLAAIAIVAVITLVALIGSLRPAGESRAAAEAHGAGEGVVTGTAAPCDGPVLDNAGLPATVTIRGPSRPETSQTVRGNHVYRLVVPAGHYQIWSNASRPVDVVVYVGGVAHVNLPDFCR